ncbi:MAG: pentapeptide repeat-containing protein [Acidimicrobiales bacterium]
MPWVEVDEPHAKPPRVNEVNPRTVWSPPLLIDRGWGELDNVELGTDSGFDSSACGELTIQDSALSDVVLTPQGDELVLEAHRSTLENCDLSQVTIRSLRGTRITGSKLTGTDLSGGTIADTIFERCQLRYANLRLAKLSRVRFVDCLLDDLDAYQVEAEDLTFPGTALRSVGFDGVRATRVDLREATEISFSAVTNLSGFLVAEHQLAGLAQALAMAVGIDVERPVQ